ncbi:MAG: 4Fe-4S dicluster domain-containing protein [Ignavibacteriaceae bacterium]|nr:4Fe-4S dicluster domain-containing protein [Ignavibacteriaceae bacterium]
MNKGIVRTILDRCKRCYSCIRECPAQAIKVINGQARVISERCIACGHCVKVCSQDAKEIESDVDLVCMEILPSKKAVAIVAPSFAASFPENYLKIPSALRKLGFTHVVETAFGADLISNYYAEVIKAENNKTIISSSCPAVINFIEKYHSELVPNLAKIVSPMIAAGKYLKSELGDDIKIVFIGPCVAKKSEYKSEEVEGILDAVLTFTELKSILQKFSVNFNKLEESDFDPPHAYLGKSFPLAGGLLKTANVSDDILEREIVVVEGKKKVLEIISEIADNKINAKFVDILFCEGCISGPAIDSDLNYYSRREKVINYIDRKIHSIDKQLWKSHLYNSRNIDFSRSFSGKNQLRPYPTEQKIKEILAETEKYSPKDELNCGACGYETCREYAVAIAKDLAEKEMCLPYLVDKLGKAYNELNETQEQLRIAEKMASIGQLAAGVAHEINNPLGSILIYSSMLKNTIEKAASDEQSIEDLELIIEEAKRCKNIVSNLLNFARQGKLNISTVNFSKLLNSVIKLIKKNPNYTNYDFKVETDGKGNSIDADEDQLKQVLLNLINNACEAMSDSENKVIDIKLSSDNNSIEAEISDHGCGIPQENFGKIFTPFFTTKKIGKGTGLGLAISYGIIKMHRGDISFKSEVGKGTTFKLKLPKNLQIQNISLN